MSYPYSTSSFLLLGYIPSPVVLFIFVFMCAQVYVCVWGGCLCTEDQSTTLTVFALVLLTLRQYLSLELHSRLGLVVNRLQRHPPPTCFCVPCTPPHWTFKTVHLRIKLRVLVLVRQALFYLSYHLNPQFPS